LIKISEYIGICIIAIITGNIPIPFFTRIEINIENGYTTFASKRVPCPPPIENTTIIKKKKVVKMVMMIFI
jgi:hypothetical protein